MSHKDENERPDVPRPNWPRNEEYSDMSTGRRGSAWPWVVVALMFCATAVAISWMWLHPQAAAAPERPATVKERVAALEREVAAMRQAVTDGRSTATLAGLAVRNRAKIDALTAALDANTTGTWAWNIDGSLRNTARRLETVETNMKGLMTLLVKRNDKPTTGT